MVGRFWSVDPLTSKYPWYTPYQFAGNKPIWAVDLDGLEEKPTNNGSREGEMQPRSGDVQSTKGPFKEIVKKDWFWHSGSKEYGTKADWYEEKDYKNVVWPIATDLAGYADMYRSPGIGKNWSDEDKANVANTRLGQFLSSGVSESAMKNLLTQSYDVAGQQSANSSGRTEFSSINVDDILLVGALAKLGMKALTSTAAKRGWGIGESITNLTAKGNVPAWSTIRQRFWKNEALLNSRTYSESNLLRMQKGLAPQRLNPNTGLMESMELHHHIVPQRNGGLFDFIKVWPDEHRALDPFRK